MIDGKHVTVRVETSKYLTDDEIRFNIEDKDPYGFGDARLNILWLNKKEALKLIACLQEAVEKLEQKQQRYEEINAKTDFSRMYAEFERKYNPYPVNMARYEAFGKALNDGLIDQDTYYAAERYYGNLWNYVGD